MSVFWGKKNFAFILMKYKNTPISDVLETVFLFSSSSYFSSLKASELQFQALLGEKKMKTTSTFQCLRYSIMYKDSILGIWFQVQINEHRTLLLQLEIYRIAGYACLVIWIQNLKHPDNSHLNHLTLAQSIFWFFFPLPVFSHHRFKWTF